MNKSSASKHKESLLVRLTSAINAISSRQGDVFDRIKSIAQVAHEILESDSILVYGKNQLTNRLELIAMPGVIRRETMRGPADRPVFEYPLEHNISSLSGSDSNWWENWWEGQHAYEESVDLKRSNNSRQGNFRIRELYAKHHNQGDLACGQIFLVKGIDDTRDYVGQVFFNFWKSPENINKEVFSEELKETLRYIAIVLRELLIEKEYHPGDNIASYDSTLTLGASDLLFSSLHRAIIKNDVAQELIQTLRKEVACSLCEAASRVTAMYTGKAEFGYIVGDRIAEIYDAEKEEPDYVELSDNSVLRHPDFKEYIFISNDVEQYIKREKKLQDEIESKDSVIDLLGKESGAIMIIPVNANRHAYEDRENMQLIKEPRAFFLLTSPKKGSFVDKSAWAMQSLECIARYLLIHLDSRKQELYMRPAFRFYRESHRVANNLNELMASLLSALDAEWGTFWRMLSQDNNTFRILEGWNFKKGEAPEQTSPDDEKTGIRFDPETMAPEGYTSFLLSCNVQEKDRESSGVALIMHMLNDEKKAFCTPTCLSQLSSEEGIYCQKHGNTCCINQRKKPHDNTWYENKNHTRIAFVVWDGDTIIGVMWLKFDGLRDIGWWEQQFISGLGRSLGVFLHHQELQWGYDGFRHGIGEHIQTIADIPERLHSCEQDSPEWKEMLKLYKSRIEVINWKAWEVDVFQKHARTERYRGYFNKFNKYLDKAVFLAHSKATLIYNGDSNDRWRLMGTDQSLLEENVSLPVFTVLRNLCSNAVRHGLMTFEDEEKKRDLFRCWFWVEPMDTESIRVIVANTLNENKVVKSPFHHLPEHENKSELIKSHNIGLYFSRAVIGTIGGRLQYIDKHDPDKHDKLPESLCTETKKVMGCQWFFMETTFPVYSRNDTTN